MCSAPLVSDLWPHVPGYESDENDHEDAEAKVAGRAKESLKETWQKGRFEAFGDFY